MKEGLLAGFFWGLDTVILGIALSTTPLLNLSESMLLAPLLSSFIHDASSSLWMLAFMIVKQEIKQVIHALYSKGGKIIVLAAVIGGPLGMSGYVLSIKYIGVGYTAIISSIYPAVGALLAFIFFNEKMKRYQIVGLMISLSGVVALSYLPITNTFSNFGLGLFFALVCVLAWASEAVIIAFGLKDACISHAHALTIRQITSALVYGMILIPLFTSLKTITIVLSNSASLIILLSALFGTAAYLFYYQSIKKIGPTKAMALNITYTAWAMGFGVIILNEPVSLRSIFFAIVVLVGALVAAGDYNEIKFFYRKQGITLKKG